MFERAFRRCKGENNFLLTLFVDVHFYCSKEAQQKEKKIEAHLLLLTKNKVEYLNMEHAKMEQGYMIHQFEYELINLYSLYLEWVALLEFSRVELEAQFQSWKFSIDWILARIGLNFITVKRPTKLGLI